LTAQIGVASRSANSNYPAQLAQPHRLLERGWARLSLQGQQFESFDPMRKILLICSPQPPSSKFVAFARGPMTENLPV